MNRFRHLLLLALMGLITACSYNELPEDLVPQTIYEEDGLVLSVETRAETYKGQALDQEYFVTAEDLENFVKFRRSASKRSDLAVKEVKSYGFDSSQTLFYILNYDQGWEVVSADKRVQPTLAHGDSGEFTMECDNEAMKLWMNMLADGILQTRLGNFEKEGEETTASAESKEPTDAPQSDHTAFWNAISPAQEDATRNPIINIPTPGPLDTLITIIPTHKYYLPHLTETFSESTYHGPFIQTSWGQSYPWNSCCPTYMRLDNKTEKSLVGCGAVAAGQMLYYLENRFDMDIISYENVICSGNAPNYTMMRILPSTGLWDSMALTIIDNDTLDISERYVAALLAHIGDVIKSKYGGKTYSNFADTKHYLFEELGIDCKHTEFNNEDLNIQLSERHMPVMIRGTTSNNEGHAWIVDGYYSFSTVIRKYYILTTTVLDSFEIMQLSIDDATGYEDSYYTSNDYAIHMNWGWDGDSDGWYSSVFVAPSSHPNDLFNINVKILYDFNL